MSTSISRRSARLVTLALALAVSCDSPEPATKTASADERKPEAASAGDPPVKARGGGGSDEVEATPTAIEDGEQPAEDEFTGYDPRVARAARVARDIASAPQTADDVLSKENLDREQLDALMYEIASDPDLTEQYRIARGL